MAFEPAPFDVVEASRRVWLERWNDEAASGMAVFTAILRSQQLLSNEIAAVMRQHDLTFARYEVLSWLAIDPESSLTLSWISKTLRIPPATVTNLIDRLEDDKLVRRVQHPLDARTTLAVITPRGERVADAATQDLNTTVYERIGLTGPQREQLIDLLAELRANGNEFEIDRSQRVIDDLDSRHAHGEVRPVSDADRDSDASGTDDLWEAMSTARAIRRFTDEPVDDDVLRRCFEAATWAPSGGNFQAWRFVILRSPEQRAVVAAAAAHALEVIEPVYGMSRPDPDDDSKRARSNRATYELHDRAGEFTSVLFATRRFTSASELLLGGSIYPAVQNFLLAARGIGLGACPTSWADYEGEAMLRERSACPTRGCWRRTSSWGGREVGTVRSAAARCRMSSPSTSGTPPPGATPRSGTPHGILKRHLTRRPVTGRRVQPRTVEVRA